MLHIRLKPRKKITWLWLSHIETVT